MPLLNRKTVYVFDTKPTDLQPDEEARTGPGPTQSVAPCALQPPGPSLHGHSRLSRTMGAARRPQAAHSAAPPPRAAARRRRPPAPAAPAPLPARQVWVIEDTGEVFRSYEAFLSKKGLYEQEVWACRYTGKGGLTLEQALASEKKAVAALEAVSARQGPATRGAAPGPLHLLLLHPTRPAWPAGGLRSSREGADSWRQPVMRPVPMAARLPRRRAPPLVSLTARRRAAASPAPHTRPAVPKGTRGAGVPRSAPLHRPPG